MATTARLTAAWDIPHITYGGTSEELGNKAEFKTLTRLSYNMNVFAKFYMDVFKVGTEQLQRSLDNPIQNCSRHSNLFSEKK